MGPHTLFHNAYTHRIFVRDGSLLFTYLINFLFSSGMAYNFIFSIIAAISNWEICGKRFFLYCAGSSYICVYTVAVYIYIRTFYVPIRGILILASIYCVRISFIILSTATLSITDCAYRTDVHSKELVLSRLIYTKRTHC